MVTNICKIYIKFDDAGASHRKLIKEPLQSIILGYLVKQLEADIKLKANSRTAIKIARN